MSVKYAAQLLSKSVADALDHCRENLKMKEFEGSEATSNFIRKINDIFDLQNSSSKFGKGLKSPFDPQNQPLINELTDYLKSLTDCRGKSLISGRRKTGFLGKPLM